MNETRAILIGCSSHAGKSTLGQSLAAKLGWCYRCTDKLARHPGRPWITTNKKEIPQHVVEHYRTLSVEALFLDVLSHYKTNVLPQIEDIVNFHNSDRSTLCLILEGSGLWPEFVVNLVNKKSVKGIWLTASDRFFQKRIYSESNFYNVSENEKYLIQKFLDRTLFYNDRMRRKVEDLGLICIDVESVSITEELGNKCMKMMVIS